VCVADGTDLAAQKIERVLTNDPGMGVIRHVDAGYDRRSRWPPSATYGCRCRGLTPPTVRPGRCGAVRSPARERVDGRRVVGGAAPPARLGVGGVFSPVTCRRTSCRSRWPNQPWSGRGGRRAVLVRPRVHVGVDAVGGADLVLDAGLLDLHALLRLERGLLGTRGLGAGDLRPSGLLVGLATGRLDTGGALGGPRRGGSRPPHAWQRCACFP
jgi:hypothetical protein